MRSEFTIGVISSVAATILVFVFSAGRQRYGRSIRALRRQIRLGRQVDEAGILYFFSSPSDYQRLRNTYKQIDYLKLAKKSIEVVAHSFGYGQHAQGVANDLAELLQGRPSLEIVFATLDPRSYHVGSLARYLAALPESSVQDGSRLRELAIAAEERLRSDITNTLKAFIAAKEGMIEPLRARFTIKVYDVLPVASVIMLDRGKEYGRTQVDLKLFGGPYHSSVSFEVGKGSELHKVISNAWGSLLNAGEVLDPAKHLAGVRIDDGKAARDSSTPPAPQRRNKPRRSERE